MATLTKRQATASFIVSEANGYRSRDDVTVTVPADTTLSAGTVLGKITASGKFVRHAAGAADGSENEAGVLFETIVNTTASGLDNSSVNFSRDAELNGHELTYEIGADTSQIATSDAALKALGLIVRR
jgi:hypothetical protein